MKTLVMMMAQWYFITKSTSCHIYITIGDDDDHLLLFNSTIAPFG